MAAAGKASQPSESDPCPLAEVRHDSTISKIEVGVHIFAYFSYLYALHTQDTYIYIMRIQLYEIEYTGKGEGAHGASGTMSLRFNFEFKFEIGLCLVTA